MGNMSLSVPNLGIGNAVRGTIGAVSGGINRASTAVRATATIRANEQSLKSILKIYRYEKLILDIKKQRGVATAAEIARQAQLVKGIRNSISALRLSTRLAVGARSTALGAGAIKNLTTGKVLASLGRGIVAIAKGMMTLTRVTFQFGRIGFGIFRKVFSVSGLWAIAELLLLFGDKIPFVKDILADFGKAFTASFAAIGRIAQYAQGPLSLLGAGITAIGEGFTSQGVDAIIRGVSNLAGIIRNQLLSAWNLFFARLGETWTIIRGIGVAIWQMFTAIYNSIASILTNLFGLLGAVAEGISQGGAEAGIQKTIYGWIKYFVTGGAKLVSDLVHGMAWAIEKLNFYLTEFVWLFVGEVEKMLAQIPMLFYKERTATTVEKGQTVTAGYSSVKAFEARRASKGRESALITEWTKTNDAIKMAFADGSPISQAFSNMMERNSQWLNMDSFRGIAEMWAAIKAEADARVRDAMKEEKPGLGGFSPRNQRREVQAAINAAMVGYSSAIIGNIIKYGKLTEEKQLDVLEEIRDDQREGLRQRGGVLLGP
jgi:hypothetical protein